MRPYFIGCLQELSMSSINDYLSNPSECWHGRSVSCLSLNFRNTISCLIFFNWILLCQAHFELQKASHQYEKANSRHVCARQQVRDTENKMFCSEEKRAFDPAMQEMLNKATTEVNKDINNWSENYSVETIQILVTTVNTDKELVS